MGLTTLGLSFIHMLATRYQNLLLDTFASFFEEGTANAYPSLKLYASMGDGDALVAVLPMSSPAFCPARDGMLIANPIGTANTLCGGTITKFTLCNKDDFPIYTHLVGKKGESIAYEIQGRTIIPFLRLSQTEVIPDSFIAIDTFSFTYQG